MNVDYVPLHATDTTGLSNPVPMIEPDMAPGYAIRYLWMQHRFDNTTFVNNYFSNGQALGMNVRKLTTHAQELWNIHNKKFIDSKENGDLIWRAKAYNKESNTIDYVEVWKDTDTIIRLFEVDRYNPTSPMRDLLSQIYETGFSAHVWYPYPTISKELSTVYYQRFLDRFNNKDNCAIDTPLR